MLPNSTTNLKWKNLTQGLIAENCLTFGQHSRLTSKNINRYLLGTRGTVEIFKLYELRYLLLRIYPLIHTLFYNSRAKLQLAFQTVKTSENKAVERKTKNALFVKPKFLKKEPSFHVKHKNLPLQVLFATITPEYANIISQAAQICSMPHHQKRWLNGSITGALSYLFDSNFWSNPSNDTLQETSHFFRQQWSQNKENWAKSKEKARYANRSRWPSLVIIPDISNNHMILREIKKVGLPVIGLVNSDCHLEIEYPIFAQDQSFSSVHFFCQFLAVLIAKEMVYVQHKVHIKKKLLMKKKLSRRLARKSFQQLLVRQKIKGYQKRPFFFNCFLPTKRKMANRSLLSQQFFSHPYKFFMDEIYLKKNEKQLKRLNKKNYYFLKKQAQISATHWNGAFKRMVAYWKIAKFDFSLSTRFKNIWQFRKQILEKHYFSPVWNFLRKEEKRKAFFQKTRYVVPLGLEKNYIFHELLQNFLWVPQKLRIFWKYKIFAQNEKTLFPTSYHWWSLQHFVNDIKWQGHKHIVPKILHVTPWRKRMVHKYNKYNKTKKRKKSNYPLPSAGSSKKTWTNWVRKTKKPYVTGPKKAKLVRN